ncbi:MAG TPA: DinB family protein [Chitinophagaceae bacterium]|nr:DinB family protein [Chitinophagaceae bacterium]
MDDKLIDDFNQTMNSWIDALEKYSTEDLEFRPAPDKWSMGQLYMHLIAETDFYIAQVNTCTACDDNATEPLADKGRELLLANTFPDEDLTGPPSNNLLPQPESKQDLVLSLLNSKAAMNAAFIMVRQSPFAGKTKHPGFGYMCAAEWLHFANLHLRHHFRQQLKIEALLASTTSPRGE